MIHLEHLPQFLIHGKYSGNGRKQTYTIEFQILRQRTFVIVSLQNVPNNPHLLRQNPATLNHDWPIWPIDCIQNDSI